MSRSVVSVREGFNKKTAKFETFVKKGGWGQDFVQTKILLKIVTRGGSKLGMSKCSLLNLSIF